MLPHNGGSIFFLPAAYESAVPHFLFFPAACESAVSHFLQHSVYQIMVPVWV
jgi:hypothetical protein